MNCSYQMDSWFSCQLGLEVRKEAERHWWCPKCEWSLTTHHKTTGFELLCAGSPECGCCFGGRHAYLIPRDAGLFHVLIEMDSFLVGGVKLSEVQLLCYQGSVLILPKSVGNFFTTFC